MCPWSHLWSWKYQSYFVGLPAGSCGDGFVEGSRIWMWSGHHPWDPFQYCQFIAQDFLVWIKVLPLSEKFAVLCFEIPSVNKANYVNSQIFSFVDSAMCCIFPAITDIILFTSSLSPFVGGNSFIILLGSSSLHWSVRLWTLPLFYLEVVASILQNVFLAEAMPLHKCLH